MCENKSNIFDGIWTLHFENNKELVSSGSLDICTYTLSTYIDFSSSETEEYKNLENKKFYITGKTVTNHQVTLYGCFFLKITKSSTLLIITNIRFNQAIFGKELLDVQIQRFSGIEFELSCFNSMMIPDEGINEVVPRYGLIKFIYIKDINQEKRIKCSIDFGSELSLQESIDILFEIRCFFVFLYCKYISINYNYINVKGFEKPLILIHDTYSNNQIPQYRYEILTRVGNNLFVRWDDFFQIYHEQIRVIFEILTHNNIGSYRSMVTCLHAIEGFFRIVSKNNSNLISHRFDKSIFTNLKKKIFTYIDSLGIDEDISKSFKNSLSYANEVTLRDRLSQLLTSYLDEKLISHFIIHPIYHTEDILNEYISILVGIRNYYAHLDPVNINSKIKLIIENYLEIYNYKVSVFSFLYILLAMEYFKCNEYVNYRLHYNIIFPFSQQFYQDRIKILPIQ